jgi:hypothetical protein
MSLKDIPKNEEIFTNYGSSFEAAPIWYKDLFLEWMDRPSKDSNIVERTLDGRGREELLKIYDEFLKK